MHLGVSSFMFDYTRPRMDSKREDVRKKVNKSQNMTLGSLVRGSDEVAER
jgi:hypothetical protein